MVDDRRSLHPGTGADEAAWLESLLGLEHSLRKAPTREVAVRIMLDETRNLFSFRMAVLFGRFAGKRWRVQGASHVVDPDPQGPFLSWLTALLHQWTFEEPLFQPQRIDTTRLSAAQRFLWEQWLPPHGYWVFLVSPSGPPMAGIIWFCDTPLSPRQLWLLGHLGGSFGETWERFVVGRCLLHPGRWLRRLKPGGAVFLTLTVVTVFAFIPVHLTVLAPARIVPIDPVAMNAPLDGVVARIFVQPNQEVREGTSLFRLEDTELENRHAIALKGLEVEAANLENARRKGFHDDRSRFEVALLEAAVAMKEAEVRFAAGQLALVEVRALRDGVAVFNDPNQWLGRPVRVGESVMVLADPGKVEVEGWIPVADAIALERGTRVGMFLNIHPHQPLAARLVMADFEARPSPEGLLGFRFRARFEGEVDGVRLGLRGAARIEGARVRLWYYLLRRPLAFLRQKTGW
ncbi:MAG: HlyD family efflux transporter periplasmic adaptor subunit [Magnetococcales bacterium]|nr:HlyD family efflux transporter periplasmic adaptor subunit [Magnetococcales bacterium]